MPISSEQQLKRQIEQGTASVYLLFGNDAYLKRQYVGKIVKQYVETDDVFNYHTFDDTADLQAVYDAKEQFPLNASKSVVTLCDYDFEDCSESDFKKLCELLSTPTDTCVFILWFNGYEVDTKKSSRAKALIDVTQSAGGIVADIGHRDTGDLAKMLINGAKKRGCELNGDTARYLIECVSDDINILRLELEKLCAFEQSGTITKKTVDLVCVKTVEASIYNLTREIFACNITSAFKLLDELFFMRIPEQIIFYTILSAYVDMYRVFAATNAGISLATVAEDFSYGKKDFLLKNAKQNLRHFDKIKLNLSFDELLRCERNLKSRSSNERSVIEQLVIRLIYIIQKGEKID